MDERLIEMSVSDAITEKPVKFSVGDEEFSIYPPTLGKLQILSKLFLMLELDEDALEKEPITEAMRVCKNKTEVVCKIMAVATFTKKEELTDDNKIEERAEFFKWNAEPGDFSLILLTLLSQVQYENFIASIRLTKILRQNKPN